MVIRDKWDIGTTAMKGMLIGCSIQLEDGNFYEVEDWYIDHATGMINIIFVGDTSEIPASSFRLQDKFIVKIPDIIKPIRKKKLRKRKR